MACNFKLSGTFPVKPGVPTADVLQSFRAVQGTWASAAYAFKVTPGALRVAHVSFEADVSAAFAASVAKVLEMWARRFADWTQGVLRGRISLDGQVNHYLFGPENRCVEENLGAIEKAIEDLHEEWTDLNYTQLPQSGDGCVTVMARVGG